MNRSLPCAGVAAGIALSAAAALAAPAADAAREDAIIRHNRELINRYFEEVWNRGRVDVLDELVAPDYLNHSPGIPNPRPGPAGLRPIVSAMRAAIPDLHYEVLDMVVSHDRVAVYTRVTGNHRGPLFGLLPKGGRIDVRQMQIEWIRDGRIVQHWRLTDDLSLLKQLGHLP